MWGNDNHPWEKRHDLLNEIEEDIKPFKRVLTFKEDPLVLQPDITTINNFSAGEYSLKLTITNKHMINSLTSQGYVVWEPEDLKDENKD